MAKILFSIALVTVIICSAVGVYAADKAAVDLEQPIVGPYEPTKDRASRAMNNMLYGPTEMPDNITETNTKGTPVTRCEDKTKSGVERGIARIVGGAWQLATFWYSDPGCVTKAPASQQKSSSSNVK